MAEHDPIIAEIHAVREALSRASDDDIRKVAEAAKARQAESGRKSVRLPPRKARPLHQDGRAIVCARDKSRAGKSIVSCTVVEVWCRDGG